MESFFAPIPAGLRVLPCAHCGNHVWWSAESELTAETRKAGRVFCSTKRCETAEGAARDAETCRCCEGPHSLAQCPVAHDDPNERDESLDAEYAFDGDRGAL